MPKAGDIGGILVLSRTVTMMSHSGASHVVASYRELNMRYLMLMVTGLLLIHLYSAHDAPPH